MNEQERKLHKAELQLEGDAYMVSVYMRGYQGRDNQLVRVVGSRLLCLERARNWARYESAKPALALYPELMQ